MLSYADAKMVYCSVVGCKNSTSKQNAFKGSMHSYPADEKLRNAWIARINRKSFKWNKYRRVCSDHFLDEDYVLSRERATQIGFTPGIYQLHNWAVPSLKLNHTPTKVKKERKSLAIAKRRNLETMQQMDDEQRAIDSNETTAEAIIETELSSMEVRSEEPENNCSTQTDVGTQAFVQTCDKQVSCKSECKSKRVQCHMIPSSTRGTQTTTRRMVDKSTTCELLKPKSVFNDEEITSDIESYPEDSDVDMEDPEYNPEEDMAYSSSDEDSLDDADDEITSDLHVDDDRKFIIYASCLRLLFAICHLCTAPCRVFIKLKKGTAVTIQAICTKNHSRIWSSQPTHKGMAEGNLCLAASLFFSGASIIKTINMLKFAKIQTLSTKTFQILQKSYIIPAIKNVWEKQQFFLFSRIQEEGGRVSAGGDGRCDSPGYCAKYGSYSLLDVHRGLILCTKLVQCNEVGSSVAMEKEALIHCIDELHINNIHLDTLITDRHPSVRKYMHEQEPDVNHYFDVWHIGKGVKKKLLAQGKKSGYGLLTKWQPSIVNHLYWAAATSNGDEVLVRAKWMSLLNHVCNIHEGHGEIFPECTHSELGERSWFRKGSREYKALSAIIESPYLMKDVGKMSPKDQTSALEGFHKLICFFAPKLLHFHYNSMKARCLLAALHFNENASRNQKRSKNGSLQWRATYPMYRKGDGVIKAIKGPCTYEYVEELMREATQLRQLYPSYKAAEVLHEMAPPTLTETLGIVPKSDLLERHLSRFT